MRATHGLLLLFLLSRPHDSAGDAQQLYFGHQNVVGAVAFNPATDTEILSGDNNNVAILWNKLTGQPLRTFPCAGGGVVGSVAFNSQSPSEVLTAGSSGIVQLWDKGTGTVLKNLTTGTPVVSAQFDPATGNEVLVGLVGNSKPALVQLWNKQTGTLIRNYTLGTNGNAYVAFNPQNASEFAAVFSPSANSAGALYLVDKSTGTFLKTVAVPSLCKSLQFSPRNASEVLTSHTTAGVHLWNIRTGAQVASYTGLPSFSAAAINPRNDNEIAAAAGSVHSVAIWNRGSPVIVCNYTTTLTQTMGMYALAFNPLNGTEILTGGTDGNTTRKMFLELWAGTCTTYGTPPAPPPPPPSIVSTATPLPTTAPPAPAPPQLKKGLSTGVLIGAISAGVVGAGAVCAGLVWLRLASRAGVAGTTALARKQQAQARDAEVHAEAMEHLGRMANEEHQEEDAGEEGTGSASRGDLLSGEDEAGEDDTEADPSTA